MTFNVYLTISENILKNLEKKWLTMYNIQHWSDLNAEKQEIKIKYCTSLLTYKVQYKMIMWQNMWSYAIILKWSCDRTSGSYDII